MRELIIASLVGLPARYATFLVFGFVRQTRDERRRRLFPSRVELWLASLTPDQLAERDASIRREELAAAEEGWG